MRPQTILISFLAIAAHSVWSLPVVSRKHTHAVAATNCTSVATEATSKAATSANATTAAVGTFVPTTDYSSFQISGGVAGKAAAEANAVFVDPFSGVDLSKVDAATVTALNVMRELAEDAETQLFNPQISAASGADATALQIGKIKNKVLKLTGEVQVLKIKIAKGKAAGDDTSSEEKDLTVEQGKLTKNIATDVKSVGKTSKAATGTVSPRSS
ncbi:hypothetical protein FRB90_007854 [Tulasnella sp. 427]|nr:hypothetical protein FRB90_007854 [Tulasnella sp. 427]